MSLELVDRYLTGELNDAEAEHLRQWLRANPAHRRSFIARVDLDRQLHENFRCQRDLDAVLHHQDQKPQRRNLRSQRPAARPKARPGSGWSIFWPVACAASLILAVQFWQRQQIATAIAGYTPRVVAIAGEALALEGERHLQLHPGQELRPGSLLLTGSAGRLELGYPDGSTITLAADTSARLRAFANPRQGAKELDLLRGDLSATVTAQAPGQPLQLHAPHGRAVVRGTTLRWQTRDGSTRLEVHTGSVDIITRDGTARARIEAEHYAQIADDGQIEQGLLVARALAHGLIAHWTFDEDDTSLAYDRSGFNHHGSLQGSARILPGVGHRGGAASFAGDGGHMLIGDPPALQLTGAMTLAAWIKPSTLDQGGRIICKQGMDGQRGWSLNLEPHGVPAFQIGDDLEDGVAMVRPQGHGASLQVDAWVHVAGVFTPGEPMRLFVNGRLDERAQRMNLHGDQPKPLPPTGPPERHYDASLPVTIGARSTGISARAPFFGLIDEVRVYRRALNAEEIRALYQD